MGSKKLPALPSSSDAVDGFFSLGYRRPPGYGSAAAAANAAAKTYYYYGEKPVREMVLAKFPLNFFYLADINGAIPNAKTSFL